jgi:hypothetical protein
LNASLPLRLDLDDQKSFDPSPVQSPALEDHGIGEASEHLSFLLWKGCAELFRTPTTATGQAVLPSPPAPGYSFVQKSSGFPGSKNAVDARPFIAMQRRRRSLFSLHAARE